MTTLHGIRNCDTVKAARAWLAAQGHAVVFRDYGRDGLLPAQLDAWIAAVGWEALLNRRGTTWRKLGAAERDGAVDAASARALMLRSTSLIKRPVVEWDGGAVTVGFDPERWASHCRSQGA